MGRALLSAAVVVGALGYLVDLYDLVLFSVVRVESLTDLGLTPDEVLSKGVLLLNLQNAGLLIGGFLWGILADKRGRVTVLFASIALYSLANLANAFVTNVEQYAVLRFVAGIGLAGELGVAITFIGEVLPADKRGLGTLIVAVTGVLGAIAAALSSRFVPWRVAFFIGGVLGLLLLFLRVRLAESGLYGKAEARPAARGSLRLLFGNGRRARRFAACVLAGLPNWYLAGILLAFIPEISRELGATGPVTVGVAVVVGYAGLGVGSALAGLLSERFRTRRLVLAGFMTASSLIMFALLFLRGPSPGLVYGLMMLGGVAAGFLPLVVLSTAEQFGTNLRATAAASVPNVVRGAVIPMTLAFLFLGQTMGLGLVRAALIVGGVSFFLSFLALAVMRETYGADLDFVET